MDLKKISRELAIIRDYARKNGMTSESEMQLRALLAEKIEPQAKNHPEEKTESPKPEAHNDNITLTADQKMRLKLIEKTGTGSREVH